MANQQGIQQMSDFIRSYLERTKISYVDLAKISKVSSTQLWRLINKFVPSPKISTLRKLAEGCGKDEDFFMDMVYPNSSKDICKSSLQADTDCNLLVPNIFGRSDELSTLDEYVNSSRLIFVSGIANGKSTLVKNWQNSHTDKFSNIILVNASYEMVLERITGKFGLHQDSSNLIANVLEFLNKKRCLLILDNLDLEHPEYGEAYHQLLEQIAETAHQSCVIVTCRSLPRGYLSWEPNPKVIRLKGLNESEVNNFLESLGISPKSDPELLKALFNKYGGNPFGLKLAVHDILKNFRGDLAAYLKHSTLYVGSLHDDIQSSVQHLSNLELELLYWLALQKEPVYFNDILEEFPDRYKTSSHSIDIDKAVQELYRRSLLQSHDSEFYLQTEVQPCVELNLLNAVQSELEEFALNADICKLHWLRCLELSDERIKLRDRLFRRDPELVGQAHSKLETIAQQPEKAIGYAINNLMYLNLGLHSEATQP